MMPWPSSSLRALSLVHQLPFTTNCGRVLAESAQTGKPTVCDGGGAHLVLGVGFGQLDRLLEDAILVLELDRLPPVIEGASHVDLIGRVFPVRV